MKTIAPGLVGPLISIDEFRTTYFGKSKPSRADVKRWIDSGTDDGVRLSGVVIEATYYVDSARVDDFFNALQRRVSYEPTPKSTGAASRSARAVERLRVVHGVGRK